jgi:putative transposase
VETFDEPCWLKTVRHIMESKGRHSIRGRKFVVATDSNRALPVAENIFDRAFEADAMNEKWVTDTTYVPTHRGWTYLATAMDLYARLLLAGTGPKHIHTALESEAVHKAIEERPLGKGL